MKFAQDYQKQMVHAKKDVEVCIAIWTELLTENFSEIIEFAYAKGSATKPWDSPIDYVPILSDVDIHLKLKNTEDFLSSETAIYDSLQIPQTYEQRFLNRNSDYLHIPRIQIVIINELEKNVDFVPPRKNEIIPLTGHPILYNTRTVEEIRKIDLEKIQSLRGFLPSIPVSILDRTGMEYWIVMRRLNWRVSPSPIRLLTQLHDDPLEIWGWNRSKIVRELRDHQFDALAAIYTKYYQIGWTAFQENFMTSKTLSNLILQGYKVLKLTIELVDQIT